QYIGKAPVIDGHYAKQFLAAMDDKFEQDFARKMKSDAFLIREILTVRMQRFLENEARRKVHRILCLEKDFSLSLAFKNFQVTCKGRIDRIDLLADGSVMVLDYKSSEADIMPDDDVAKIKQAGFERARLKHSIKSFQLPLYLYFAHQAKEYRGMRVNAALYTVKSLDKNLGLHQLLKTEADMARKEELLDIYLKALESLLEELFNPDIPFQADEENTRLCQYCPFFYLCR
ncbi:MAG: PD-(D/E)XK nuclease family protein, partial [Candidatus Omnitrophica bacterium]|nr:PD-(D/E)XK nuclease family protein [Candidatus Omnitrophota bacterium]